MNYETTTPAPVFVRFDRTWETLAARVFDRFSATKTKIAIQKDGELTQVSREIVTDSLGVEIPDKINERQLLNVSKDGEYGFVYARNKSICDLVVRGAVDLAVVGTDRLIEDEVEDRVEVVKSYEDQYSWPLLLATVQERDVRRLDQIRRVATQYPRITKTFFESKGTSDLEVVPTLGGTEAYPYLDYGGEIDAVVDLSISGVSMLFNRLVPWTPSIYRACPVLIKSKEASL